MLVLVVVLVLDLLAGEKGSPIAPHSDFVPPVCWRDIRILVINLITQLNNLDGLRSHIENDK